VIGTVTDDNLVSYTLSIAQYPGGEFVEIANGSTPVTNGLLGQFDPTLLSNDTYILRLEAVDAGGRRGLESLLVNVAGELKLGNFRLSFTDLTIPIGGLPISVSRTYDTLTTHTAGDFGRGWRMEFRDVNLRTSVPATGMEDLGVYGPFRFGTRVYLALPGGKREGFTFEPTFQTGTAQLLGLVEPSFTPDPGNTSTLTVPQASLLFNSDGTLGSNSIPYLGWLSTAEHRGRCSLHHRWANGIDSVGHRSRWQHAGLLRRWNRQCPDRHRGPV
jgi:hypothetical protein